MDHACCNSRYGFLFSVHGDWAAAAGVGQLRLLTWLAFWLLPTSLYSQHPQRSCFYAAARALDKPGRLPLLSPKPAPLLAITTATLVIRVSTDFACKPGRHERGALGLRIGAVPITPSAKIT